MLNIRLKCPPYASIFVELNFNDVQSSDMNRIKANPSGLHQISKNI